MLLFTFLKNLIDEMKEKMAISETHIGDMNDQEQSIEKHNVRNFIF